MQSRRAGAAVGRVGSGLGRGARGAGGVVGRGAGLGAGAAIFEQLIMKIFELFEGTPVLEEFIEALDEIFKAAGPVIGILLKALTPVSRRSPQRLNRWPVRWCHWSNCLARAC